MDRIKIKTDVRFEDMHEIIKVMILKNSFGMIRIFYFLLFALGYSSLFRGSEHPINEKNILIYIAFVLIFFFVVVLIDILFTKETVKRIIENDNRVERSDEKIISKEGIIVFRKDREWLFKWSDLLSIFESENMYMLTFKECAIYINKSALKSYDDMHFFMVCLQQRNKPKVKETDDYIVTDEEE